MVNCTTAGTCFAVFRSPVARLPATAVGFAFAGILFLARTGRLSRITLRFLPATVNTASNSVSASFPFPLFTLISCYYNSAIKAVS